MQPKNLSDVLIELQLLTKEQVDELKAQAAQEGKLFEQILVQQKSVSKSGLAQARAHLYGLPFVDSINDQMADPALLGKVPLKFLRQHSVIPVIHQGQELVLTADPYDLQPLDELTLLLGHSIKYAVAPDDIIAQAINKYYPLESSKEMLQELDEDHERGELALEGQPLDDKDVLEMANEAPIVKLVNHMLVQAVKEDASDIHIEPFEKELRVRYRVDGTMYERFVPPKRYQSAIVSRVKIMSNLNIAEKRMPQGGRIQIKIADKPIDLRVSVLPCNFGERVVIRLLDKTRGVVNIEALDLADRDKQVLLDTIRRPNGIVLVSGPTGSGKTTTLYSILSRLNQPSVNLITVEDPVEYTIHGISQVQVNEAAGLTFPTALREILRQDPDIVLIGEIRDPQTAQIATQAALTGHLVLSTIHTNSAPATITRLIDMGIEPFLIASSLVCVMSQRLVRRLCQLCKKEFQPTDEQLRMLGMTKEQAKKITFFMAVGCDQCLKTGYKGRLPIFEIMEVNDQLARLIVERADATVIQAKALEQGMKLLAADGLRRISQGQTTIEEVMSVAYVQQPAEV